MKNEKTEKNFPGQLAYRVGLDLGSSSIGWAVIQHVWDGEDWRPNGIEGLGVRIFPAGTEGDVQKGRDESRAIKRRMARGTRRTLARRAGRMHELFLTLVKAKLLPMPLDLHKGPLAPIIHQTIKGLDVELVKAGGDAALLPYFLRAKAIDSQLTPYELGRALYHLAQRRGFKSNKRADAKVDGEERGKVKEAIRQEEEQMQSSGARTRGELLSREEPETKRIRARYHGRENVENEFNTIWEAQKAHHQSLLRDELRNTIHKLVFFQRPLKPVDHLVGHCSLEPGRWIKVKRTNRRDGRPLDRPRLVPVFKAPRRLALADPLAQQVRLLQRLNDITINHSDGTISVLTPDQRAWLLDNLQKGDVTLKTIHKEFGLKKQDKLNFDEGASKTMVGNRTANKITEIIGIRWDSFSELEKTKLVYQIIKAQDIGDLKLKLEAEWGLTPEIAIRLAEVNLEDGYLAFSRTACEKLLPGLLAGQSLNSIREELYGASKPKEAISQLSIVAEAFPDLRNPVVSRVLTELRKVVRAIIRKWGLPHSFTLELARDLKKNRDARKAITKKIEDRTKEREKAKKILIDQGLVANPRGRDIEKYLLWEECRSGTVGVCPYTGGLITLTELFSSQSPWDIEHIIPYSRSLDDSFANKTLCWSDFNRNIKHNKLPMELGSEAMEGILLRVLAWPNSALKTEKLRRFRQTEIDGDFISSQLNDTAYATRLAGDYLAMLYGGRYDSEKKLRIYASKGQATAKLRDIWGMNKLLGGFEKNRGDHRHHAIDALVLALTTPKAIQTLSNASKNITDLHRLRFEQITLPWDDFILDSNNALENLVVSRRPTRSKLSGRLHEETNYGVINNEIKTARVPVESLKIIDLKYDYEKDGIGIVNPVIKKRIEMRLQELWEENPAKAFKDLKNHPYIETKDLRRIPIHKVTLAFKQTTIPVGADAHRTRHVVSDSNHHMAVFETKDSKGKTKWTYEIVSLLEAMKRHAKGLPIIDKKFGFLMTLRAGDTVMYEQDGSLIHAWVRTVTSDGKVGVVIHSDARLKAEQQNDNTYKIFAINVLSKMKFVKTLIDPVGEIRISRD